MTSLTGLVKLNNFVVQSHRIAGFGVIYTTIIKNNLKM